MSKEHEEKMKKLKRIEKEVDEELDNINGLDNLNERLGAINELFKRENIKDMFGNNKKSIKRHGEGKDD